MSNPDDMVRSFKNYTYDHSEPNHAITIQKNGENLINIYYQKNADRLFYDANGGEGTMSPSVGKAEEQVTVEENGFTHDGYEFTGWNTEADGSGKDYDPGDKYTLTDGEDKLFAQWKQVIFPGTPITVQVEKDGEHISADGVVKATEYEAGGGTADFKSTLNGEGNLDITYTYDNLNCADIALDVDVPEGYDVEVESDKTGTTIGEVNPDKSAEFKLNGSGASWTLDNTPGGATVTVKLTKKEFTVSYKADNGGWVSKDSETVKYGEDAEGSAATPNEGYYFVNWTNEEGIKVSTDATFAPKDVKGNATYTARFAKKMEVSITGKSATDLVYNGSEQSVSGFVGEAADGVPVNVDGQTYYVKGATSTASGTNAMDEAANTTVNTDKVQVVDANGNDVTDRFTVTVNPGQFKINKRDVELTANSATKVYDGTALTDSGYKITSGSFVGEEGLASVTVEGSITDPGDEPNVIKGHELKDGTLADNYNITYKPGNLHVDKVTAEIVITADSSHKTYDGTALTDDGYTYTQGVLAEGDELTAVVEGSATNVSDGRVANKVTSYKVMRGETDVTANYTFGESVDGELYIEPRDVELTANSATKVYDGTALTDSGYKITSGSFVGEEGLASVTVEGSITDPGDEPNVIKGHELKDGTLADNYNITYKPGNLHVDKVTAEIVITADSSHKTYDGTALTDDGYTYTQGVLAEGDELTAVVEGSATNVSDGRVANKVTSYKVMRGETDVTANYTFGESVDGELYIEPRDVELTANSATKVYDGTALTDSGYKITSGSFVGEEGLASVTVEGSITDPGDEPNVIKGHELKDGTLADNYNITYKPGNLHVDKVTAEIVITADSSHKTYDGTALTDDGYTYTQGVLAEGDELTAVVEGSATNVSDGRVANKVTSYKVMRGETDVTANYTFGESVDGELYIEPRDVELTANSATKVYDGTALTDSGYKITSGSFVGEEGLASVTVEGSITDPGDEPNVIKGHELKDGTLADNYNITYKPGNLHVDKVTAEIVITADSSHKTYDGTALTDDGYTYTQGVLAEGDELTAVVEGSATNVSDGRVANKVTSYKVMRGETDVTANYTFGESVDGELYIEPRDVELTANSATKVYDGTALTDSGYKITSGSFVGEEGLASVTVEGSITDPGDEPNVIKGHELKDGTLADNYNITYKPGNLHVDKVTAEIVITADSSHKTYDGTALTDDGYTYTQGVLAEGDELTAVVEGSATNVSDGRVANKVTSYKVMRGETDVTANYTFGESVDGELYIEPRDVELTANSATKVYDGTALTDSGYKITSGSFVGEEGLASVTVEGSITDPGDEPNVIKGHELKDGTLADNYNITYKPGNLHVDKVTAEIVITADSSHKTYDGTALTDDGYTYTQGVLAEGDELTAVVEGSATNVSDGRVANKVTSYKVMRGETDVTANYTFGESVDGELYIEPRSVTAYAESELPYRGFDQKLDITSNDAKGVVSGETLTLGGATITGKNVGVYTDVAEGYTWSVAKADGSDSTGNYAIDVAGKLTITKAGPAQFQGTVELGDWTYGDTPAVEDSSTTGGDYADPTYTYSADGGKTWTSEKPADAGSYIVKATWAETDNCLEISATDDFTIAKRPLDVLIASQTKPYDGTTALGVEPELSAGNGFIAGDDLELSIGIDDVEYASKDVANDIEYVADITDVVLGGADASNYEVASISGTGNIVAADPDAEFALVANGYTGVYDGAYHEGVTGAIVNPVNPAASDDGNWEITYSTEENGEYTAEIPQVKNVNDSKIIYVKASNPNYKDIVYPVNATVTKRTLTISTPDATKVYDGRPLTNHDATVSGLVEGETLDIMVTGTRTAVGSSPNRASVIWNGTALQVNYDEVHDFGTLTVTPAPVTPDPTPDNPPTPPIPGGGGDNPTPGPDTPGTTPGGTTPGTGDDATDDNATDEGEEEATEETIDDDATPMASGLNESSIADDATPLASGTDTDADQHENCWVHWLMIVGIVLSVIYFAGVGIRRSRYTSDLHSYENQVLGVDDEQNPNQNAAA